MTDKVTVESILKETPRLFDRYCQEQIEGRDTLQEKLQKGIDAAYERILVCSQKIDQEK